MAGHHAMPGFPFSAAVSTDYSQHHHHPPSSAASPYLTSYISTLVRAEPYPPARYTHIPHPGDIIGLDSVCEFAARILFSAVEWARNIPGFPELQVSTSLNRLYVDA